MQITRATRRDIIDLFSEYHWAVRLEETKFLGRLFDLETIPSTDPRFKNAQGDIWQHRVNNDDWDSDWVFDDPRFNLL